MTDKRKIVFLGSNPSNASPFLDPFTHCRSAHVLAGWLARLGLRWEEVTFANVANYKTIGNKPLTGSQISAEIPRLIAELSDAVVIALGTTAQKAAKKTANGCYPWPAPLAIIPLPHPSGMNRLLNDQDYVAKVLDEAKSKLTAALSLPTP